MTFREVQNVTFPQVRDVTQIAVWVVLRESPAVQTLVLPAANLWLVTWYPINQFVFKNLSPWLLVWLSGRTLVVPTVLKKSSARAQK